MELYNRSESELKSNTLPVNKIVLCGALKVETSE